jgi:hypothetical protein
MSKSQSKIAVIVINYNGKKYLHDCFSTLIKSDKNKLTDLILIDSDSSDDSIKYCQKNFPSVLTMKTPTNLGFSGAYNYAHHEIKKSGKQFDYYFILNNDTTVDCQGIFERAIELFEADKSVGIVAPAIIDKKNITQVGAGDFIFLTGTTLGLNNGKVYKPNENIYLAKWASGCAMFIRSEIFEKAGGFDDYFMYMEDVGLSWKTLNLGYKIIADNSISIVHFGGGTAKPSTLEHYYSERNRLIMYWQNLSIVTFILLLPFFLIFRLLLLLRQANVEVAKEKLKALVAAFSLLSKYPRLNNSFSKDLQIMRLFNSRIKLYDK